MLIPDPSTQAGNSMSPHPSRSHSFENDTLAYISIIKRNLHSAIYKCKDRDDKLPFSIRRKIPPTSSPLWVNTTSVLNQSTKIDVFTLTYT